MYRNQQQVSNNYLLHIKLQVVSKEIAAKCRPIVMAPPKTGNDNNNKNEVTRTDQTNNGNLCKVIPGARMVKMVVMKFTPPRIVPNPPSAKPNTHKSQPIPGENVVFDKGAYANHPNEAAP